MAYSFISINFPGAIKTAALGINENGQIVGLYVDVAGTTHGYLDQNNVFTTIDDPLGTNSTKFGNSVATGVNNPEQIVGYYFDPTGVAHGFIDNKGTFTTLDPNGAKGTFAEGVAENGRIVGYYLDGGGKAHGFLDDKGSFTTIDFTTSDIKAGSVQTFAQGINDPGQIVGYYLDSNNKPHGFLYDKTTFTPIDAPSAVNGTFVEGIAENKLIVGYYLDANNHAHGFIDHKGVFTTVDDPSGTDTFLQGVNDSGQITGYYFDASGVRHGFEANPLYTHPVPVSELGANPSAAVLNDLVDFDGNHFGSAGSWHLLGQADIQNDGDLEFIYTNPDIGRWATLGPDSNDIVDLANHGAGGDTRVVGIYIDPLIQLGVVQAGSPFDSQQRFQGDLYAGNIEQVFGFGDFNHDGLQEIYFGLKDHTAVLHAYMHTDGNIQYANYQNFAQAQDYLVSNGIGSDVWGAWLR
jgi:probable HAF family extracellular repeat protein